MHVVFICQTATEEKNMNDDAQCSVVDQFDDNVCEYALDDDKGHTVERCRYELLQVRRSPTSLYDTNCNRNKML